MRILVIWHIQLPVSLKGELRASAAIGREPRSIVSTRGDALFLRHAIGEGPVKLFCYPMNGCAVDIQPASSDRDWIDNTREKFANRCLPLVMANAHGWEILGQESCEAR